MRIQHLALKTNDLQGTYAFYTNILGLDDAKHDPEGGRIWLNFADGFTLIFDRSDETLHPSTVQYLGLELEDFSAVDKMYQKLAPHAAMGRDMRDQYRKAQGPYGFFVRDPNGYQIKVFKYNA